VRKKVSERGAEPKLVEMADAVQDVDARGGALDTAKDLFAGAVGGVAQVLIGS
jgi:hypothetical protein